MSATQLGSSDDREGNVVELEFELGSEEFFLATASKRAECNLRLEEVYQRSDGAVLEYLSVEGADPERVLELAREAPIIREARLLSAQDGAALFEFVSESRIAAAIADRRCRLSGITATAGNGRVRAEVPPHIDASAVISAFLEEYPGARLTMRRETDHEAPLVTERQVHEELVSELTDRQLQVLRLAYAEGYFAQPREASGEELARELGITPQTFAEHLRRAERKVFDQLFGARE